MDQLEREELALEAQLAAGEITQAEYNRALLDLQRDYRDAAHEAADEAARHAYDDELDRW